MADARFSDADDQPLRLKALDADDIPILSALLQDAVLPSSEMSWMPGRRRLAALVNRFRWEDHARAKTQKRPYERVQCLLQIDNALRVRSNGIDPNDKDLVFALLSIDFAAGPDGAGMLNLTFAGDGTVAVEVECIDVTLRDVSRPYAAPSGLAPDHDT